MHLKFVESASIFLRMVDSYLWKKFQLLQPTVHSCDSKLQPLELHRFNRGQKPKSQRFNL